MKRLLLLGIPLFAGSLALSSSMGDVAGGPVGHGYRLDLHGTAGVRVHMLLITKAAGNGNPERREEVITLPMKIDFQAQSCYAWFDTLPKGASGNEGDTCNVDLVRDGHKVSACEGIIKKQNQQTEGVGDL